MQKNWSWGHSDTDTDNTDTDTTHKTDTNTTDTDTDTETSSAQHGFGDLPEEERTPTADTDLPEQGEDVRVAGTPSEDDDAAVTPATSEHSHDDTVDPVDTTGTTGTTGTAVLEHEHEGTSTPATSEHGHDNAVAPATSEDGHDDTVDLAAARDELEPERDDTGAPATPEHGHDDTVLPQDELESEHNDAVIPAISEDEPAEVAEPAEVVSGISDDVVTERPPSSEEYEGDRIEQLVEPATADSFKGRWREVQSDFVDDPHGAVRRADELASEVLTSLTDALNGHKQRLDDRWRADEGDKSDTERLRQALRGYRDFFDRMLGA